MNKNDIKLPLDKGRRVVYFAIGYPYLAMALNSLNSLLVNGGVNNIKIIIISDRPKILLPDRYDNVFIEWVDLNIEYGEELKEKWFPFRLKTFLFDLTDGGEVLFIDSDTVIYNDLNVAFKNLNYFDMMLRPNRDPRTIPVANENILDSVTVGEVPHFNSGVIFFRRNKRTEEFFNNWKKHYEDNRRKDNDQVSLSLAVLRSQIKIGPLSWNFNSATPEILKEENFSRCNINHYSSDIYPSLIRDLSSVYKEIVWINERKKLTRSELGFFKRKIHDRILRGKFWSAMEPGTLSISNIVFRITINLALKIRSRLWG